MGFVQEYGVRASVWFAAEQTTQLVCHITTTDSGKTTTHHSPHFRSCIMFYLLLFSDVPDGDFRYLAETVCVSIGKYKKSLS